uniref:PAC domain-containing protein n=1 Tax=Glossina morsitans morsitans TaxID=37546 RepID=A0A1B0FLV1_GLOMM
MRVGWRKCQTPLWLLLQVAPIRNERDLVVLFLLTFRDITALKQPIDSEDTKGARHMIFWSNLHKCPAVFERKSSIRTRINGKKECPMNSVEVLTGLSKFAKLARSVTRSRQFSAHLPTLKDPTKQSNLAHVPYNVAFKNKTSEDVSLLVVDSIVDVIFFIDIVLNFHTTFVGPGGEVVSDPKVIRMNYLKSWFIIDLLSCLPYDVFNAFDRDEDGIGSLFSALKVVRLLRLGRVVGFGNVAAETDNEKVFTICMMIIAGAVF